MGTILPAALSIAAIGGTMGVLLGVAAKVFSVYVDPRTDQIDAALPQANCGACGFPGCRAYAEAVASGKAVPSLCIPGGSSVAANVAKIMGVEAGAVKPMVALLKCTGTCSVAKNKYDYHGPEDCNAAMSLGGGPKACAYGCMGLGSCVRVCKFNAMWIGDDGIVHIDRENCTGCGKCVEICPKKVLELIPVERDARPKDVRIFVRCNNTQKGAEARKVCDVACIACMKCEKACPVEGLAIHVNNNLAKIDYEKCIQCGKCADVCPTKCIEELPRKKKAETSAA